MLSYENRRPLTSCSYDIPTLGSYFVCFFTNMFAFYGGGPVSQIIPHDMVLTNSVNEIFILKISVHF